MEKDYTPEKGMRAKNINQRLFEAIETVTGQKAIIEYAVWKTVLTFLDTGKDRKERVMEYLESEVSKWLKD